MLRLLLTAILIIVTPGILFACEPCHRILTFEESYKAATLVIVGERSASIKPTNDMKLSQPDSITGKILRTLKGQAGGAEITVNSWDGMCDYGITVGSGEHLMLLVRRGKEYDTVNFGCSFKSAPVKNDSILVSGKLRKLSAFESE